MRELITKIIEDILSESDIKLKPELNNFNDIGINSLGFIKLIVRLEEELDIVIPDEYLTIAKIEGINQLVDLANDVKEKAVKL